jgi:hypothetical protein
MNWEKEFEASKAEASRIAREQVQVNTDIEQNVKLRAKLEAEVRIDSDTVQQRIRLNKSADADRARRERHAKKITHSELTEEHEELVAVKARLDQDFCKANERLNRSTENYEDWHVLALKKEEAVPLLRALVAIDEKQRALRTRAPRGIMGQAWAQPMTHVRGELADLTREEPKAVPEVPTVIKVRTTKETMAKLERFGTLEALHEGQEINVLPMVAANLIAGGAAELANPADARRLPEVPAPPRDIVREGIADLFRPLKSISSLFNRDDTA